MTIFFFEKKPAQTSFKLNQNRVGSGHASARMSSFELLPGQASAAKAWLDDVQKFLEANFADARGLHSEGKLPVPGD
jgi:hypothetical protein